jgi:hypothetical protein
MMMLFRGLVRNRPWGRFWMSSLKRNSTAGYVLERLGDEEKVEGVGMDKWGGSIPQGWTTACGAQGVLELSADVGLWEIERLRGNFLILTVIPGYDGTVKDVKLMSFFM